MVSDLTTAVVIVAAAIPAAVLFVRWDMWLERRARKKFDAELEAIVRKRESDV